MTSANASGTPLRSLKVVLLEGVVHGVDAAAVVLLEEAGSETERLGDVAIGSGPSHEIRERRRQRRRVGAPRVEVDVAAGELVGVARAVDRSRVGAAPLE